MAAAWDAVELRSRGLLQLAQTVSALALELDAELTATLSASDSRRMPEQQSWRKAWVHEPQHEPQRELAVPRPQHAWRPEPSEPALLTRTQSAQRRQELAAAKAELARLQSAQAAGGRLRPPAELAATRIGAAARGRRERQALRRRHRAAQAIGAAARGRRQRKSYNHATATPLDKTVQRAVQAFRALDADGNGVLSGDELKQLAGWVFDSFHPQGHGWTEDQRMREAARLSEQHRLPALAEDGVLGFAEFSEWFRRTCVAIEQFRQAEQQAEQVAAVAVAAAAAEVALEAEQAAAAAAAAAVASEAAADVIVEEEEGEGMDLWGDGEEDGGDDEARLAELAAAHRQKRQDEAAGGAEEQPAVAIVDVKPWDDETDMAELEAAVRQLSHPGGASLAWGESSLEEVGFGIKKLTIRCQFSRAAVSVEEDIIGTPSTLLPAASRALCSEGLAE